MKPSVIVNNDKLDAVKRMFNDAREPENDWQALLKATISQVMDDYIRLQHPSKRDQTYLKEAFCTAIACLWDEDYTLIWPGPKDEIIELSFREALTQRFGLDNLDKEDLHKINMGLIQQQCINEAVEYWIHKELNVVKVPDFLIFEGRAFSIWATDEESSVDYDTATINLQKNDDPKQLTTDFIKLALEIGAYYKEIKVKKEVLDELGEVVWELLRMNKAFHPQ